MFFQPADFFFSFFPQRFGSLERIGTRKIDQVEISSHVWSSDLVGRNSLRPSPRNCDLFKALTRLDTVPIRFLSLAFYFPRLGSPLFLFFVVVAFWGSLVSNSTSQAKEIFVLPGSLFSSRV